MRFELTPLKSSRSPPGLRIGLGSQNPTARYRRRRYDPTNRPPFGAQWCEKISCLIYCRRSSSYKNEHEAGIELADESSSLFTSETNPDGSVPTVEHIEGYLLRLRFDEEEQSHRDLRPHWSGKE
ncbi:unnamed protein product [Musa acuminata subsp. malaccensis]|uniref:(wild Malaysian banana) hypothetical protein n=1 Tax=Musa acuminata subsp. malaccensis TaxID=214687 RepID=A0A804HPF8_MUSAM|nr:unnamed protein product [Musa acuminata subsp. malaccensis]